jgi:hypothetical protein
MPNFELWHSCSKWAINVTNSSLVQVYWCFEGYHCLHPQCTFIRVEDGYNSMTAHSRRLKFE